MAAIFIILAITMAMEFLVGSASAKAYLILPLLIPLIVAEFALLAYTIWHILTHKNYKHGNRVLWLIIAIIGMEFIGPILYFLFGKEDNV